MSFDAQRQERTREAANIRAKIKEGLFNLEKRYPHREPYIPDNDLPNWVTPSAIGKWIETSNIEVIDRRKMRTQIFELALKTFCILMEIEKEDSIPYFIERADIEGPDKILREMTSPSLKTFLQEANNPRQISGPWSEVKCEEFCKVKWKYFAFHFVHGNPALLPDQTILPFRMTKKFRVKGEAKLFCVDFDRQYLHAAPRIPSSSKEISMMRKELALEPGEKEQKFVRYLQARQKQHHPHIIELYAYYIHKRKGNLLMSLLQGDLKELLTKDTHIDHFRSDDRYLAEMLHLSEAMASLHRIENGPLYNIAGVHHDVKPDNVLLDHGKFVLSDFGIANMRCPTSGQEQESYGNNSWWIAPEALWDGPWQGKVGPKSDVFSLGCIFTELLVHMRGSAQSVMAFRERRRPNKNLAAAPFHIHGKIIEEVLTELGSIRQDTECAERAQIAGVVLRMLAVDPEDRLSAKEVVAEFRHLLQGTESGSAPTDDEDLQQFHRPLMTPNASQHQPRDSQVAEATASSPVANEHCLTVGSSSCSPIGISAKSEDRANRTKIDRTKIDSYIERGSVLLREQKHREALFQYTQALHTLEEYNISDPALQLKVYFRLITIELDLSCHKDMGLGEKIKHHRRAERYCPMALRAAGMIPLSGVVEQVRLEQSFVQGRKTELEKRKEEAGWEGAMNAEEIKRVKLEASNSIERAMRELSAVNLRKSSGYEQRVASWLKRLSKD